MFNDIMNRIKNIFSGENHNNGDDNNHTTATTTVTIIEDDNSIIDRYDYEAYENMPINTNMRKTAMIMCGGELHNTKNKKKRCRIYKINHRSKGMKRHNKWLDKEERGYHKYSKRRIAA